MLTIHSNGRLVEFKKKLRGIQTRAVCFCDCLILFETYCLSFQKFGQRFSKAWYNAILIWILAYCHTHLIHMFLFLLRGKRASNATSESSRAQLDNQYSVGSLLNLNWTFLSSVVQLVSWSRGFPRHSSSYSLGLPTSQHSGTSYTLVFLSQHLASLSQNTIILTKWQTWITAHALNWR
jgi:hypothetical protein